MGWYLSYNNGETLDERWTFSKDVVKSNMTLYAKWLIQEEIKTYDIDTLIVNYHRQDGDYSNLRVWIWISLPEPQSGKSYSFVNYDSERNFKQAVINFSEELDEPKSILGLVIGCYDWSCKEFEEDLYIDLSFHVDGVLEVFIISGIPEVFYSYDELP